MNRLVKEICKREGKKSQTSIYNVREVLNCFSDILVEEIIAASKNMQSDDLSADFCKSLSKKVKKALKLKQCAIHFDVSAN